MLEHIAYLLPHTDVTAEMDVQRMMPGYIMHTQRMRLDAVDEESERRMVRQEFPAALSYLKGVVPYRCAIFGCTSAGAVDGRAGMQKIERLMSAELGCPAATVLSTVLRQLEQYTPKALAVLTPYTGQVNTFMKETFAEFQIHPRYMAGMGLSDDHDIAALAPEEVLAFAAEQAAVLPEETDLVFFSCTNVRAAEIRDQLVKQLCRPVITSNQCVMDYIREICGAPQLP